MDWRGIRMRIGRQCISIGFSALILASTLQGCSHWAPLPVEPVTFEGKETPSEVRVALVSGRRTIFRSPVLSGDSLIGIEYTAPQPNVPPTRVAVPIAEISQMEARKSDRGRSMLLIVLLSVGIVLSAASTALE